MKKYISALNLILFAVFITYWCEERDGRTNSNKLKGRSRNYESNSFYQDAEVYALASLSQNCYQNHETYKGVYDEIWTNEQGLRDAADARETQGIWKTVGGVFLVVGGTVCIVASGGAATPIVAAGWAAGGGTIAFGVADSIEGAQDIYYGSIGDIDSTSMNYLKSVVFQGNEDAYYLTENVFAFASSAFIPISQAARVGNLTFRSGMTTVAKEGIAMAAGAGASDVTMRVTGSQTASMVAGMLTSWGTGHGLNGVDTRFNISGNRVKREGNPINYSGMDWYNYYRDMYGKENVCWESCNPSKVAAAWQGTYPYVGIDNYKNITLCDGDIIWMGEPYPTGYSTTTEVVQKVGNDAKKIFEGLQVKPYYEKGMQYAEYRGNLTPYRVNGNINVADGVALKNPQFGVGGLEQRFDPNFDYNVATGLLTKIDSQNIELINTKVSLEEYFNMMNRIGE